MSTRTLAAMMTGATILAAAPHAGAAITGVGGMWLSYSPTPPLNASGWNLATCTSWNEQTSVPLTGVMADIVGSSATINYGPSSPAPITGLYDSHMMHLFSVTGAMINGSISFSQNIAAVIFDENLLDLTDASCGSPATIYPTGQARGFSSPFLNGHFVVAGNTITFDIFPFVPGPFPHGIFEFRVLTAVPAPAGLALAGATGLLVARRRRAACPT